MLQGATQWYENTEARGEVRTFDHTTMGPVPGGKRHYGGGHALTSDFGHLAPKSPPARPRAPLQRFGESLAGGADDQTLANPDIDDHNLKTHATASYPSPFSRTGAMATFAVPWRSPPAGSRSLDDDAHVIP